MTITFITLERRERVRQEALLAVQLLTLKKAGVTAAEFTDAIRQVSRGGYTTGQIAWFAGRKDDAAVAVRWLHGENLPRNCQHELSAIYGVMRVADPVIYKRAATLG